MLRRRTLGLWLLAAVWFTPARLYAAPPHGGDAQQRDDSVTSYAFEDDLVPGGTVNPHGDRLQVRRAKDSESLVRARSSFVDQMLKSIETL